jgi:hypothetical protein
VATRWKQPPGRASHPHSSHVGSRQFHFLSSCSVRAVLVLALSTIITVHNRSRSAGIRRSAPTYRKFRFLRSLEGLIALCTIPQEGTLSIFGQVLGYPRQHDERASFNVKIRNNCYPISQWSLQYRKLQCGLSRCCLFLPRKGISHSRLEIITNPTVLTQHHFYHLLLYPHTMPSERVIVCIC